MGKGKKILLGIVIVIVGFMALSVLAASLLSDEEKEQLATERENKERDEKGLNLKSAWQIEPSKLSNSQYKMNAQNILSKYVLEYKGKDLSGKNMKTVLDDLNDEFHWCDKNVKWEVEIGRSVDHLILLDVETEFMKCTSPIQLEFVYDSQMDHLRHNNNDLNPDLEKSIINLLDKNR